MLALTYSYAKTLCIKFIVSYIYIYIASQFVIRCLIILSVIVFMQLYVLMQRLLSSQLPLERLQQVKYALVKLCVTQPAVIQLKLHYMSPRVTTKGSKNYINNIRFINWHFINFFIVLYCVATRCLFRLLQLQLHIYRHSY